jgi:hypothetical protein
VSSREDEKLKGYALSPNHEERYRISGKPAQGGLLRGVQRFLHGKNVLERREQTNTVNGGLSGDDPLQNV